MKPKRILVKLPCEAKHKCADRSLQGSSFTHSRSPALKNVSLLEELFRPLIINSPHATSITTLNEGRYVEVNEAWLETTGCQRHYVIGKTVEHLIIDDGLDKAIAIIRDIGEKICGPFSLLDRYESCRIDAGGHFQVVCWTPTVVFSRHDSSAYTINSGVNITRQRKTEESREKRLTCEAFWETPSV